MKKALVTGGAGFIGSHLVDALVARAVEVVVYDDLSTGKMENLADVSDRITFVKDCVSNYDALATAAEGADVIFHLAAIASVQKSVEDPITTYKVNTGGTLNALEVARKLHVSRVVYASSSAVYGDHPDLPKREDSVVCPKTPYGLHKLIGEGLAKVHRDLFGISSASLRFFNVYGPRQDPSSPYSGVISIFKDRLSRGEPITIFGDGGTTRDFVYVSDVVQALLAAAEKENADVVYNIGTGIETSLLDVVKGLKNALGVTATIAHGPERTGDIKRSVADISKAKRALDWEPRVSFAEGVERLAKSK